MRLFTGFQLDLASDFTGLSEGEIRGLRQSGIVTPQKTTEGYKYSFQDLLMLRLIRLLKQYGVKLKNIKRAHQYLGGLDPSKRLANFKLYIRTDSKQILYLGENPQENTMVALDQFGQLMATNVLAIIPVGEQLESLRKNVISFDQTLATRINSRKVVPLGKFLKRHGLA